MSHVQKKNNTNSVGIESAVIRSQYKNAATQSSKKPINQSAEIEQF